MTFDTPARTPDTNQLNVTHPLCWAYLTSYILRLTSYVLRLTSYVLFMKQFLNYFINQVCLITPAGGKAQ
jgi:hypothetical protein